MARTLLHALLMGYYVPDMEYTFRAPDVCCARWNAEDWLMHVTPFPVEFH
jgi:hypothetical protein